MMNKHGHSYMSAESVMLRIRQRKAAKIYRRRRLAVALLITLLTAILVTTVVSASGDGREQEYAPVAVESGDTLWELAARYYPGMPRRDAISKIKDINGLRSSAIQEGDVLMLPDIE